MSAPRASVAAIVVPLAPGMAIAQGAGDVYPAKPVRVVVGLAPGGATDLQAFQRVA